jgi:uncharacterized membrane protein
MTTKANTVRTPSGALKIALWAAQCLLAAFFINAGITKLITPAAELGQMMPWTLEIPSLVMVTGIADLLGGIGILLPALTRILPSLTKLAAVGLLVLQGLAIGFHVTRGEMPVLALNALLILLLAFVLWGRTRAAPITPR